MRRMIPTKALLTLTFVVSLTLRYELDYWIFSRTVTAAYFLSTVTNDDSSVTSRTAMINQKLKANGRREKIQHTALTPRGQRRSVGRTTLLKSVLVTTWYHLQSFRVIAASTSAV